MNGFVKTHLVAAFTALLVLGCAQSKMNSSGNSTASKSSKPWRAAVGTPVAPRCYFWATPASTTDSGKYAPWLAIKLFETGINTSYTVDLDDLNPENLAKYDALIIYANHDAISPAQESALKDFVQSGKGLVPLHSASGCFLNSEWYLKAIGGQFASHKTGDFPEVIVKPDHPIMKGLETISRLGRNLRPQKH